MKKTAKKTVTRKSVAQGIQSRAAAPATIGEATQIPKVYATGPTTLRDEKGNIIPLNKEANPVDSALPKK